MTIFSERQIRLMREGLEKGDRGTAVAYAAFLEANLGFLIAAFIEKSTKDTKTGRNIANAILKYIDKLSNRIEFSHSLGLIEKREMKTLKLIGKIRNKFAHYDEIDSFKTGEVITLCENLTGFSPRIEKFPEEYRGETARMRYTSAVMSLHLQIDEKIRIIREESEKTSN